VFGLKKSILAVLVYILIGICGVPVFSGFGAGVAAILGPTGGYIIGFIFIPLIMNVFIRGKSNKLILSISMLIALLVCYLVGTAWYCLVYNSLSPVGIWSAISICVIPFVIPDLFKILIATLISARLKPIIDKLNFNGGRYD
jgi:biotin transport system substrate-specific component